MNRTRFFLANLRNVISALWVHDCNGRALHVAVGIHTRSPFKHSLCMFFWSKSKLRLKIVHSSASSKRFYIFIRLQLKHLNSLTEINWMQHWNIRSISRSRICITKESFQYLLRNALIKWMKSTVIASRDWCVKRNNRKNIVNSYRTNISACVCAMSTGSELGRNLILGYWAKIILRFIKVHFNLLKRAFINTRTQSCCLESIKLLCEYGLDVLKHEWK